VTDELVDIGERRAPWRAALTIHATVGVMDALVSGASLALALGHLGAPPVLAVLVGIAVALLFIWLLFENQNRRFAAALRGRQPNSS
jgi:Flp pilus assembly protein TadB